MPFENQEGSRDPVICYMASANKYTTAKHILYFLECLSFFIEIPFFKFIAIFSFSEEKFTSYNKISSRKGPCPAIAWTYNYRKCLNNFRWFIISLMSTWHYTTQLMNNFKTIWLTLFQIVMKYSLSLYNFSIDWTK